MQSVDDFRSFFENELSEKLDELEIPRKQAVKQSVLLILIVIACIGGGIGGFIAGQMIIAIACGVSLIVAAIVLGISINKKVKYIKKHYKDGVIRPIVHYVSPELSFSPTDYISQSEYIASKIFLTGVDRYKGDDLVQGKIGATSIRFSEIHSEYKTKDKDGKTQWHTIFKGIFFVADFNKHFKGETFVLPDLAEKWFGGLGKMMQKANFTRPELIKLEDPTFEKHFVVYGTDQIEGRYILSPKLMERITKLRTKAKKISISFINAQVSIAINVRKNLFEPPYWSSMKKFELVEKYYAYLLLCVNIVEELDLNTRIWTKE